MKNKFTCMGGVLATLILATLVFFVSCSNGSTGDSDFGTYSSSDIDYSLGDAPAENLKFGTFSAEDVSDGIFIKYTIPQGNDVQSCTASIEGIGLVHENYGLSNKSEGEFFYPFVTPNKEYKVRFVFNKPEKKDPSNTDFTIYDEDTTVLWFETTVKAGANSKGEVRLEKGGSIKIDRNGDFGFTERPKFYNENLLTGSDYDWVMEVGLNMGVSWEHGTQRRSWWMGTAEIPQKEIAKTHNLYSYLGQENVQIDFIVVRPAMQYKYNGKEYRYLWQNLFVIDCHCTPQNQLWKSININNSNDVKKITGTWKYSNEYYDECGWDNDYLKIIVKDEETLIIDSKNVTFKYRTEYTKSDGSQFTDSDKGKVGVETNDKRTVIVSSDNKTITKVYKPETESISEAFADWSEVKLFQDGNILRITETGTKDGSPYEYYMDYKRQN